MVLGFHKKCILKKNERDNTQKRLKKKNKKRLFSPLLLGVCGKEKYELLVMGKKQLSGARKRTKKKENKKRL